MPSLAPLEIFGAILTILRIVLALLELVEKVRPGEH
jgi:hypothetical protein